MIHRAEALLNNERGDPAQAATIADWMSLRVQVGTSDGRVNGTNCEVLMGAEPQTRQAAGCWDEARRPRTRDFLHVCGDWDRTADR